MTTFFHRGQQIEDVAVEAQQDAKELSLQEFGKRALAEVIALRHQQEQIAIRMHAMQHEITTRILNAQKPKVAHEPRSKKK